MSRKINLTKEDLEEYYVKGLHTAEECASHFGMARTTLNRYLKKYGIERSKEDKSKVYSRAQNSEEVKEKIRNSNIAKYGSVNKAASESPIRFVSDSAFSVNGKEYEVSWLKEKYLIENVSSEEMCSELGITYAVFHKIISHYRVLKNSEQRYELIRQKTLDKYGVVSTFQLDEVKEKSAKTCLEKYGVDNPMKNEEVQVKCQRAAVEKRARISALGEEISRYYIDENHSLADTSAHFSITTDSLKNYFREQGITKDMKKAAILSKGSFEKRYGVDSYFKTDECKEKLKQLAEKNGVDAYPKSDECKKKAKESFERKYGCFYVQTDEFKEKSKNTSLNKYGVEYPIQSDEVRQRIKDTNIQKYGVGNYNQKSIKNYVVWNSKEKMKTFLSSLDEKPSLKEISEYFNVSETALHNKYGDSFNQYIDLKPKKSRYEDDIKSFLISLGIDNVVENDRSVLDGKEIDLYIPDEKLGIEFNGDYWHSDIFKSDHGGRSTYQQKKSLAAEEKGVFIFNIFEREWNDILTRENIKDRLRSLLIKNDRKIPARKCSLCELDASERSEFLNLNHIQGNCGSSISYGLKFQGELVACMSFSHPKSKKYTWELSRFCTKRGATVQGGASKLFKEFVKKNLSVGDTVSSYNDITKTKGYLYKVLGFELVSVNSPNYVWINFKTKDVRTRYQEQKAGEIERMHSLGYHRVCDCGTKTWVYTVK